MNGGSEFLNLETKNIMMVNNLYKSYISNQLSDILDDEEEIIGKLVTKYEDELKLERSESTFVIKSKLKNIIEQKIKDIASCDINNDSTTKERQNDIILMEQDGNVLSSYIFRTMIKQLQLEKRLYKEELTIHIKILENMWYHLCNGYYYPNEESKWEELFAKGIDLYYVSFPLYNERVDSDTLNLIKATKYLERLDIEYEIFGGEIILCEDSHIKIHLALENLIKGLGGIETLMRLFNREIQPKYKKDIDRYLIHRNKSLIGETKNFKRVPYNYLINICGKFLNNSLITLTYIGQENNYNKIINISSNYLAILQLQGHSVYEDMFVEYKKIPEYIYKNIIFENLYIPIQYKPNFVLNILKKLYKPLYDENKIKKFTFDDYYKVANVILNEYTSCSVIKFEELRVKLGVKRKILRTILNEIAGDKEQINKEYTQILTPTNLFAKPLVKIKEDIYFMVSPHFCGYSFCNVIYQMLRRIKFSNLNRRIGDLTENYVKNKLNEKNIPFKSGYYAINNQIEKGECDVVLETKKEIVFLEIKKRSLPEEFQLGDDVEVLRSLGDGMLNAQKQILRHRVYLQKHNFMKLYQEEKESSSCTELVWKGHRIVSISMCLPEYGFLTNKTISAQLLESLMFATYHATDPEKEKSLNKLNKLRDQIAELAEKLRPEDKKDARTIFFDTLFRSLQQFIYVLEISSNVEELVEYLTSEIYLADGSLDFYSSLYSSIKRGNRSS